MFTLSLFAQAGGLMVPWMLLLIGLFMLIYGIMHTTNLKILWMEGVCGLSALVAGAVCVIKALMYMF